MSNTTKILQSEAVSGYTFLKNTGGSTSHGHFLPKLQDVPFGSVCNSGVKPEKIADAKLRDGLEALSLKQDKRLRAAKLI